MILLDDVYLSRRKELDTSQFCGNQLTLIWAPPGMECSVSEIFKKFLSISKVDFDVAV